MRKQLFILCAILFPVWGVLAQALSQGTPEEVGISSERLELLSRVFQDYSNSKELSGSVVLVARKGQIAFLESFGQRDIEKEAPMEDNTIFRIASQTKAIVSVGIMILQEEGKLLISDPVGKYIPAFNKTTVAVPGEEEGDYEVVEATRKITIRDLLTHTAGIGYGYGTAADQWEEAGIQGWYFADRDEPVLSVVERMAALPQDAQPGEQWVYGYNTDILGALINVISGEPLDQFLQKRIFDPLGMTDTHFYLPKSKRDRLAAVYSATDGGLELAPDPGGMVGQGAYIDGPRKCFSGGAGLLSTAQDYARFLQMMLDGGTLDDQRIISRKTVELMTVNHTGDMPYGWGGETGFGLGFSIVMDLADRGVPGSLGEFGWGGAYHSTYWVDPAEELVVVYFTQLIPAGGLDDHSKLRTLVYQALK